MTDIKPNYSAPWVGQDGNEWRQASYWNGAGWQTFLQHRAPGGEWTGW